jgi:hypothetical protein
MKSAITPRTLSDISCSLLRTQSKHFKQHCKWPKKLSENICFNWCIFFTSGDILISEKTLYIASNIVIKEHHQHSDIFRRYNSRMLISWKDYLFTFSTLMTSFIAPVSYVHAFETDEQGLPHKFKPQPLAMGLRIITLTSP